jgi:hypothetical protein
VPRSLAGLVMLLVTGAAGASEPRPLAPIDRNFSVLAPYETMYQYRLAVRDTLLGRETRRSCEAVVTPSFEREWAIHLQQSRDGGGPEVVCTIMQEQLWGRMEEAAERPDKSMQPGDEARALRTLSRKIWRLSAPLSATTATALERLWAAMLGRAEQRPSPRCLDGTSYYLFQWDRQTGSRGGWGRCPQEGSPAGAVLEILKSLRKCAGSSGTDLMRQDMALAVEAYRLLRQVNQLGNTWLPTDSMQRTNPAQAAEPRR